MYSLYFKYLMGWALHICIHCRHFLTSLATEFSIFTLGNIKCRRLQLRLNCISGWEDTGYKYIKI